MLELANRLDKLWSKVPGVRAGWILMAQVFKLSVLMTLVNLGVVGLIVYLIVSTVLDRYETFRENEILLSGQSAVSGRVEPRKRPISRPRRLEEYRVIAARDLFGTAKNATREKADAEEVRIEEMPSASLKLKLMGTVVASDPAMRKAIIAEANGRNERMYREGESVKGVVIKKILRYAVVLDTGQREEVLKMERPKTGRENSPEQRIDRSSNETSVSGVTFMQSEIAYAFSR
jgi:type II secretory pathway component PulC